jgi:hypothetical protein
MYTNNDSTLTLTLDHVNLYLMINDQRRDFNDIQQHIDVNYNSPQNCM